MNFGRYQVVGRREYRGHVTGVVFEARLERRAAARAVARGDIVLLEETTPAVQPNSYVFPEGWLSAGKPPTR